MILRAVATRSLFFGDEQRPLAGTLHAPACDARDTGVVLANPFGVEVLSSRRAYRHLADSLAREGIPALRFDYDGTGDSVGTDEDPDRLEAWLVSIERAVRELRRTTGVRRVLVFGVRLGALLARAYAARHPVDGIALIACPPTGRAHVREMRTLESLRQGRNPEDKRPDGDMLSGFFLSTATAEALSALDVSTFPLAAPSDAFVAVSDDPGAREERIVKGLLGSRVVRSKTAGYTDMMRDDPYKSVVPDALWSEVVAWALEGSSPESADPAPVETRAEAYMRARSGVMVREEAVTFDGMSGVLTEPASGLDETRPTLLLLNIGANHHVGNGRLYVSFARDWAAVGFRVLRFDRSGIGDSPARSGRSENEVYASNGIDDTRAAMSFLTRARGASSFALAGVCSGAYYAYYTAIADPRVVGVIMMNLLTFQWKEGDSLDVRTRATFKSTRSYARDAMNPETILRIVRGEVRVGAIVKVLASRVVARGIAVGKSALDRDPILRKFRELDSRRVSTFLVFSDTDAGVDLIEQHLGSNAGRMARRKHFAMRIVSGADHTFLNVTAQNAVRGILVDHLTTRFSRRPTRSVPPPPPSRR